MKKLSLLFILPFILLGCSANRIKPNTLDYDDIENVVSWSNIFNIDEDEYLVYFYSVTCGHCKEIKGLMIDYYFSNLEQIYFSEVSEETVYGQRSDLTGIDKLENFYIFGTPFLIKIEDKIVSEYYSGVKEISEYINYKS